MGLENKRGTVQSRWSQSLRFGTGTIWFDGHLLPIALSKKTIRWASRNRNVEQDLTPSNNLGGTISARLLFDPRGDAQTVLKRLRNARTYFLAAIYRNWNPDVNFFWVKGLLLECVDEGNIFRRLGYIDPQFARFKMETHEVLKRLFQRQIVCLI